MIENFIPFEEVTLKTSLEPSQVIAKVKGQVEPKKMIRFTGIFSSGNHKPFEGTVSDNSFQIARIINYKNSFIPQIKGEVKRGLSGTSVHLKMKVHTFVLVFMCVFLGLFGFGTWASGMSLASNGSADPILFIPILMLLFFYVVATVAFKYESNKAKKHLIDLLKAKIEY